MQRSTWKRNRLWQRLHRYRTMPTLFHQRGRAEAPPVAPAQAALLPALVPDLPVGQVVDGPAMDEPQARVRLLGAPDEPLAVAPVPSSAPEGRSKGDDASWRRLETIFKRHQERKEGALVQRKKEPGEGMEAAPLPELPVERVKPADVKDEGDSSQAGKLPGSAGKPVTLPGDERQTESQAGGPEAAASGDLTVGGDAVIGGGATVAGNITTGGSVIAGGQVVAGGSVSAGGAVTTGTGVSAGGSVTAGGNLSTGQTVTAGSDVSGGSSVVAGQDVTAGAGVQSGAVTSAGERVSAGGDVTGAVVSSQQSLEAGGNVAAGAAIKSEGTLSAGGDVISGGAAKVEGTVLAGAGIVSAGPATVKGTLISGGDVSSSAGLKSSGTTIVGGDIQAAGLASLQGSTTAGGDITTGGAAKVSGIIQAGGSTAVSGSATIAGSAVVGQNLQVGGSAVVGSAVVGGDVTVGGAAVGLPGGSGGTVQRQVEGRSSRPPLQEVWEVEQRPVTVVQRELEPAPPAVAEGRDGEAVRAALASVQTGQPSRSGVQLVMPRGPRPAVQRQREPVAAPPRAPEPVAEKESLPDVETEIGTLPADLWELIDRRPPPPETGRPVTVAAPALQRAPAAELAAPVRPAETAETGREAEGPEVDVDELARQVYAQLRRRLLVEWERLRGWRE